VKGRSIYITTICANGFLKNLEVYRRDEALAASDCAGESRMGPPPAEETITPPFVFSRLARLSGETKSGEFTRLLRSFLIQLFQDFPGGIGARTASQSSSRMGTRAAKIQIRDRSRVPSPVEQRSHGEKLIER